MSPTDAPSHELARFLADQLRGSLPEGIEIEAVRSDVVTRFNGLESKNGTASILDEDDGRSFVERLVTATDSVISHVQDVAAEKSAMPWPSTGASMPLPHVEVVDRTLHACFGDPRAPVLALAKIDVAAFGG